MTLLLALTDQFGQRNLLGEAQAVLARLEAGYDRAALRGHHRRAVGQGAAQGAPPPATRSTIGSRRRSTHFERAEAQSPAGIEDAILRWNACARVLNANPQLVAKEREELHEFGDDPPGR